MRVAEVLAGRSGPAGVRRAGRPPGWLVNDLLDERELVRRCAWGSEWAQREVIRAHRPRLYLIAYHLIGDRESAEGVVEQAFVVAFRSLERADPRPSLEPWLNAIVLRTAARTAVRRSRPGTRSGAAARLPSTDLAGALVELPFRDRAAVVLRRVVGLENVEAARELDLSLETFKSHLLRGTWFLRTALIDRLEPAAGAGVRPATPHDGLGIRSKVRE